MKDKDTKGMTWETGTIFGMLLAVIIAVDGGVLYHLSPITDFLAAHEPFFTGLVRDVFVFLVVVSFPVSLIFLIGTIVSVERLKLIRKKEKAIYGPPEPESAEPPPTSASPETIDRWRKIVVLADSDNQNDWKQAIIDADSILDEMLSRVGYQGEDLGSKLRSATYADFNTLEQAGEAHGVRNRIAHDGSNFALSKHEAKRVINLYRQVFEEFFYI